MRLSFFITVLIVAIQGMSALAQQLSSREDFAKFRQDFKGRWVGEGVLGEDTAGLGKKGEKVTAYCESRIVQDGNAVVIDGYAGNGSLMVVLSFDPGAKQIKGLWITSAGDVTHSIAYKNEDGNWVEKGTRSSPDGIKTPFTRMLIITDNGRTHTWIGSLPIGSDQMVDRRDVWRRVTE